ncbi:MAG TPA: metallopeptidase family protein [Streptosporangiaceae bacterium]
MQTGDRSRAERSARIRRRDRHGRGLRGILAPPDVPLHRTRAERFDDLVLQAVARLEPRWEAHLAGVEFAVEEIPPVDDVTSGPAPLAKLEPGSPGGPAAASGTGSRALPGRTGTSGTAGSSAAPGADAGAGAVSRPPRIVVYRRPLMARADGDDDLTELIFEVVVEEFAHLLGMNPEDIDPGYPAED